MKAAMSTPNEPLISVLPGRIHRVDLRPVQPPISWDALCEAVEARGACAVVIWVTPARFFGADHGSAPLISMIQRCRRLSGTGGTLGPTALICSDFMPIDYIGPVRASAIQIGGQRSEVVVADFEGVERKLAVLDPPAIALEGDQYIRLIRTRPRLDFL